MSQLPATFILQRKPAKCMMRSDEHNLDVHGSYAEETALSSNVNVTDEDESKEIIVHITLSENQYKDVSESECNIVHKTLSQNNAADVPDNVITELKYDEHKEPLVTGKVTSYFNIFKCGRNQLNQLDVTYQRVFMASPVRKEYYTSPARERYYEQLTKSLINLNVGSDGTINNDKLNQEITYLKAETEEGHEFNINDIMQVDVYNSPGKNKDTSRINDSAYYKLDEHEGEISDSSKQVEASKEPIKNTHIVDRVRKLSGVSVKPAVTGVGIIGRVGRGINQGMINGGTGIISSNVVTDVLTDSNKMVFKTDTFPLNPFKSQTLVIALQDESTLISNRIV